MNKEQEQKMLASMTKYDRKKYLKKKKQEQEKRKSLLTKIGIAAAGLVLVLCVSLGIYNSSLPEYTIGDEELSSDEYNFYYNLIVNNFINNNYYYLSLYGLDIEKPLNTQVYDETTGKTWEDFFKESTDENLQELMSAKIDADKNNYICKDLNTQLEDYMHDLEHAAEEAEMSLANYVKSIYGNSMDLKEFKGYVSTYLYISSYLSYKYDEIKVTDEDVESKYANNADDYNVVDGYLYQFKQLTKTDPDSNSQLPDKDETKAQAEALYEKIKNGESFVDVINATIPDSDSNKESYKDGSAVTIEKYRKSGFTEEVGKWLFSNDRKENDTTLIYNESDGSYYLVKFTRKYLDKTPTVDVKHILVSFETDSNGNIVSGGKEKAKEEIDKIKAEFDKNPTVENFDKLAEQSDDTGSSHNGGLYEGVSKGDMVDNFDAWIFDENRKEKDVEIIETEIGYHLMYYVGTNKPAYQLEIINTIKSDIYSGWLEGILVEYKKK